MKNDHYKEEGRNQSVDEELEKIELDKKSSWKSREEIVKEGKERAKEGTIGLIEGLVLASLGYFIGFFYIIPSYDDFSFWPYFLTLLLIAVLYGVYYGLKHLWIKRRNRN